MNGSYCDAANRPHKIGGTVSKAINIPRESLEVRLEGSIDGRWPFMAIRGNLKVAINGQP